MFIGHFGVGIGAKAAAPKTSLGTLILSAQLVDLVWPTLLLLGWEQVEIRPGATVVTPLDFVSYPFTHSLLAAFLWGALAGGIYYAVRKYPRGALTVGLLVLSHWVLDFLTHRPDLPLLPGGSAYGLGLWNSLVGTVVVETALFAAGIWLYLRTTRSRDRTGVWAFWGLIAFLAVVHLANLFGPPPPDVSSIAWAGHLMWLFVPWGFWIDRHREARHTLAT